MATPLLSKLSLAACLGSAAAAQAGDPGRVDPVQPAQTARHPDSAEVARGEGISEAEARRRLRLQEVSAPFVSKLRREFADRLAGLYRESRGDYRLVVRLEGEAAVADRWIGTGRDRMRIQFLAGAPATLAETLEKVAAAIPAIGAQLPGLMGTGVDERTGEVVLDVYAVGEDLERARAAEPGIERLLGHPVRLQFTSARISEGQESVRPPPHPPVPGSREWNGHMQRLARSARYPATRIPGSSPFIANRGRSPSASGPTPPSPAGVQERQRTHAVVLFTGDAAAHLARYTRDPRYWPKSVGLTQPQLRALQDSFGKLLQKLEIRYTYSSSDEENNQVTFAVSEMDKYRQAVATGRLKPDPHVVIVQDKGPIAGRLVQARG